MGIYLPLWMLNTSNSRIYEFEFELDDFSGRTVLMKVRSACEEHIEKLIRAKWIYKFRSWNWKWFMKYLKKHESADTITFLLEQGITLKLDVRKRKYLFYDHDNQGENYQELMFGSIAIPADMVGIN